MNVNASQLIAQIAAIATQIVSYGLLILMFVMVAQQFGFRIPSVPAISPTVVVYVFGCWYLYRK